MTQRAFIYSHVVGFEETNLVGNVYYVNHLRWQGRCREMFLKEHCPEVLDELDRGLALVTTHCGCHYFDELVAFTELEIRMKLGEIAQNRVTMLFDYVRLKGPEQEVLVARGEQQIACMTRKGEAMVPVPIPAPLREALELFR